MFTYESLLPPSSFQATSSINRLLTDYFSAVLWQGSLRLGMFLLDLAEHHPSPSDPGPAACPRQAPGVGWVDSSFSAPSRHFLSLLLWLHFSPRPTKTASLKHPFKWDICNFQDSFVTLCWALMRSVGLEHKWMSLTWDTKLSRQQTAKIAKKAIYEPRPLLMLHPEI